MSSTTIVTPPDDDSGEAFDHVEGPTQETTKLHTILVHKVQLHPWLLNQLEAVDPRDPLTHLPKTTRLPTKGIHPLANHQPLRKYPR